MACIPGSVICSWMFGSRLKIKPGNLRVWQCMRLSRENVNSEQRLKIEL